MHVGYFAKEIKNYNKVGSIRMNEQDRTIIIKLLMTTVNTTTTTPHEEKGRTKKKH